MKNIIILSLLIIVGLTSNAKSEQNMKPTITSTNIGQIAYYQKEVQGTTPIIFLHGVYYDHNLWNYQISRITDRTTVAIDMPLHGKSKNISKKNWTMEGCSQMLIDILDSLNIEKCYAIGHSWGSMTILRAASQHPQRFEAVGLCNMPIGAGSFRKRLVFGFQHTMLGFRTFYTKQVAKAMFGQESRNDKPQITEYLELSMGSLSNKEVRKTDKAVIMNVDSGIPFLEKLKVPALAIKGKDDYVQSLANIEMTLVKGKHTSPLEAPQAVLDLIYRLVKD